MRSWPFRNPVNGSDLAAIGDRELGSLAVAPVDVVEPDQRRVAPLAPAERGRHELAEQRRRPVRTALELRVRLRADPERMAFELDELDEQAVGRRAGAHE